MRVSLRPLSGEGISVGAPSTPRLFPQGPASAWPLAMRAWSMPALLSKV